MEDCNQNSCFDPDTRVPENLVLDSRVYSLSLNENAGSRNSNSYRDDSTGLERYDSPRNASFESQGINVSGECDNRLSLPTKSMEELNDKEKELKASHQKPGKYFFYDFPLAEDTGVWIPVSVPPMLESDHEEWARGFHSNGGYFPEGDMGWGEFLGEEKELTMWNVIVEMILAARGKVNAFTSSDIQRCGISWLSSHLLEQAWQ